MRRCIQWEDGNLSWGKLWCYYVSNKIISEWEHGVTGGISWAITALPRVQHLPRVCRTRVSRTQSECMNRTIILMVINTVFNDMIVPSIIILTPLPIWSSQPGIKVSASIFMFHWSRWAGIYQVIGPGPTQIVTNRASSYSQTLQADYPGPHTERVLDSEAAVCPIRGG